eukprot:gene22747-29913_t
MSRVSAKPRNIYKACCHSQDEEQLEKLDPLLARLAQDVPDAKYDRSSLATIISQLMLFMEDVMGKINLDIYANCKKELERLKLLGTPTVYVHPSCGGVSAKLREVVAKLGGHVAEPDGAAGVTHIVYPFGRDGDPDDGKAYMRVQEFRGFQARVHWWYYPDSYEEYLSRDAASSLMEETSWTGLRAQPPGSHHHTLHPPQLLWLLLRVLHHGQKQVATGSNKAHHHWEAAPTAPKPKATPSTTNVAAAEGAAPGAEADSSAVGGNAAAASVLNLAAAQEPGVAAAPSAQTATLNGVPHLAASASLAPIATIATTQPSTAPGGLPSQPASAKRQKTETLPEVDVTAALEVGAYCVTTSQGTAHQAGLEGHRLNCEPFTVQALPEVDAAAAERVGPNVGKHKPVDPHIKPALEGNVSLRHSHGSGE